MAVVKNNKLKKEVDEIIKNYKRKEESIMSELLMTKDNHAPTIGSYREDVWARLFREILPKKYSVVNNSFIIDSKGKISKEIDIVIYDEYYVPYIFQYGEVSKIIPIESVLAVVQCKSKCLDKANLEKWIESINGIESEPADGVARLANNILGTNDKRKTKPIKILCSLTPDSRYKRVKKKIDIRIDVNNKTMAINSELFEKTYEEIAEIFNDVPLSKNNGKLKINEENLKWIKELENPIIKLSFLLNQVSMLINNPMLFSHKKYGKMFKK